VELRTSWVNMRIQTDCDLSNQAASQTLQAADQRLETLRAYPEFKTVVRPNFNPRISRIFPLTTWQFSPKRSDCVLLNTISSRHEHCSYARVEEIAQTRNVKIDERNNENFGGSRRL
jgi:hypothetical protein